MRKLLPALTLIAALTLTGCGDNTFKTTDEQVKASWSEVINQYQRRADLVPNLKGQSPRDRAIELFAELRVRDTEHNL